MSDTLIAVISAVFSGGALSGLFAWLQNRKMSKIQEEQAKVQVKSTEVDYTDKIIEQSDKRVKQALDDREQMRKERDEMKRERNEALEQAKKERKAKQEYRQQLNDEKESHTNDLLKIKELEADLREAAWHRCEVMACQKRIPPRKEPEPEQEDK